MKNWLMGAWYKGRRKKKVRGSLFTLMGNEGKAIEKEERDRVKEGAWRLGELGRAPSRGRDHLRHGGSNPQ